MDVIAAYKNFKSVPVNLNMVNLQTGASFPEIKDYFVSADTSPMTSEDVKSFEHELNSFYGNIVQKELALKHPPKIKINSSIRMNILQLVALYQFETNEITINQNFLTNPDNYKLVSPENGMCILNPYVSTPVTGTKKQVEQFLSSPKIKKKNIHGRIEKMTKDDRKKLIKTLIYHESIHAKQFDIARRTEGIGHEGVTKASLHNWHDWIGYFLSLRRTNNNTWAQYANEEGEIKKDSQLGQKGYQYIYNLKNYNIASKSEDYYGGMLEKEAYGAQKAFAERENLNF